MEGTITWYPISDGLPAILIHETGIAKFTGLLLLILPDNRVVISKGVFTNGGTWLGWQQPAGDEYNPTHYAYINYPTTSQ